MTRTLTVSDTGLRLIKAFEGFRPEDKMLVTGTRVVGYGHRIADDETLELTRAEAEEWLIDDLMDIEDVVNDEVHAPLSQNQFDALVSLAFNIGIDAFRSSDVVRALNNGRILDAANGFDVWRKATIAGHTYVVDALMRRRTAEKSLFLQTDAKVLAPSAMLKPKPDPTAPMGPTDDGLPRFSSAEAAGIVAHAAVELPEEIDDQDIQNVIEEDTPEVIVAPEVMVEDELEAESEPILMLSDLADGTVEIPLSIDDPVVVPDAPILTDEEPAEADSTLDVEDDTIELDPALVESEDVDLTDEDNADIAPVELMPDEADVLAVDVADAQSDEDIETDEPSPIAAAADSLGERLSALLDDEDEDTPDMPVSLTQDITDESESDDPAETVEDERKTSNLLAFPTRQRVMEEKDDEPTTSPETDEGVLVIDNLAADDVMRASQGSDDANAPDGDPVENAMRYLESRDMAEPKRKGGGLWIPLVIGASLVGASGVLIGRGATELLSNWGPTAATSAAITGVLMVLFAIYAAARGRFA